jgi:alpha-L-rhamnosidase
MPQAMRAPRSLQADGSSCPLGIDEPRPRLAWLPPDGQLACRVRVATSPPGRRAGELWDSGWVQTAEPSIRYAGPPLASRTRYLWTVRVAGAGGGRSPWSRPSWFETALLDPGDWAAGWIGAPAGAVGEPLLRRVFMAPRNLVTARLFASGLGYADLRVNGLPVDDRVLDPAPTDYTVRVPYSCFDVTALLRPGRNVVTAALGRGFYGLRTGNVWGWHRAPWHGRPRLLCQLEIATAGGVVRVVSDARWRAAGGPTIDDSVYGGEQYDARREPVGWTSPAYDDSGWSPAVLLPAPGGRLRAQRLPPVRAGAPVPPAAVEPAGDGGLAYDFGGVRAGWAALTVRGDRGTEVVLSYGETRQPDGTVETVNDHVDGPTQVDRYVLRGGGEERWEPRFSYKGFRYVHVSSDRPLSTLDLRARSVHADVTPAGGFDCSDGTLRWLDGAAGRTIAANLHGVLTDTPTFEKNGWTADAHLIAETAIHHFDMRLVLRKALRELGDAQRPDGGVPVIAPTPGWGTATDPCWSAAYPLLAWNLYEYYGDIDALDEHYAGICAFADHLHRACRPQGWVWSGDSYADWLAPGHLLAPEGPRLPATAFVYHITRRVAQMAAVLDRPVDADRYASRADEVATAFQRAFFDEAKGYYRGDSDGYRQAASVLPLAFGLVPADRVDAVVGHLVRDVVERCAGHLDTGALATKYLLPVLTDHGRADVALTVATQQTPPGWGHWRAQGSTTLHESWDAGSRSRSHHFLGSAGQWLRERVAGLRPTAPGWARIAVAPMVDDRLAYARADVMTVRGRAAVAWRRCGAALELDITVPPGAQADVDIPVDDGEKRPITCPGSKGRARFTLSAGRRQIRLG